jgi:hypothetical protein
MPDKGKEYTAAPAKDVRPVPAYSRRARLAEQLARADNAAFKRNAVNRLWALMMGRGLIHPVDMDHADNPPSHPELLELLADEFVAMKFDVKALLRELALTQTYQRSSTTPAHVKEADPARFTVAQLKPLSPEQLGLALMQATGFTDAERKALGAKASEAALYARLSRNLGVFVTTFGGRPGQPAAQAFEATLDQTLFLANGALIRGWLGLGTGGLAALADADAATDELYLGVLTRLPSAEERQEVSAFLKDHTQDRGAALQELAWALLTSAEFRFNH